MFHLTSLELKRNWTLDKFFGHEKDQRVLKTSCYFIVFAIQNYFGNRKRKMTMCRSRQSQFQEEKSVELLLQQGWNLVTKAKCVSLVRNNKKERNGKGIRAIWRLNLWVSSFSHISQINKTSKYMIFKHRYITFNFSNS